MLKSKNFLDQTADFSKRFPHTGDFLGCLINPGAQRTTTSTATPCSPRSGGFGSRGCPCQFFRSPSASDRRAHHDRQAAVAGPYLGGPQDFRTPEPASKPGHVWLGMQGHIFGRVKIGASFTMSVEEFRSRGGEHLWPAEREPPYARLCGLPLEDIYCLPVPLAYWRPAAAIGWHVYRTKAEDLPLKSRGAQKQEGPTADMNSQPKRSKASHEISERAPEATEEEGAEGNQPET